MEHEIEAVMLFPELLVMVWCREPFRREQLREVGTRASSA